MSLLMYAREHMRTWRERNFRLELYDMNQRQTSTGRNFIEYELFDEEFDKSKPVIGPIKMPVPVTVAIDSDEVIAACINWQEADFIDANPRIRKWLNTLRLDVLTNLHFVMTDEALSENYWKCYHEANEVNDSL